MSIWCQCPAEQIDIMPQKLFQDFSLYFYTWKWIKLTCCIMGTLVFSFLPGITFHLCASAVSICGQITLFPFAEIHKCIVVFIHHIYWQQVVHVSLGSTRVQVYDHMCRHGDRIGNTFHYSFQSAMRKLVICNGTHMLAYKPLLQLYSLSIHKQDKLQICKKQRA